MKVIFLFVPQFPSQVASVLNSPFLQHVLSCNPDFVMLQRLNFWLNHSLYEGNKKHSNNKPKDCNCRK